MTEEESSILQSFNEMRKLDRTRLPALREIESEKLRKEVKKLDALLENIKVDDIKDVNDLIYCSSAVVVEILRINCKGEKTSRKPW